MNIAAIKHFAYGIYCYALDEDTLEISIETGKDAGKVFITYGDPFARGIFGGGEDWDGNETEITEKKDLQTVVRWTIRLKPEYKRCRYYFRILSGSEEIYFLETGFYTPEEFRRIKNFSQCFCFPWMNPSDVIKTPSWAEKTVWYQIFPARFARGKIENEPSDLIPWGKLGKEIKHSKKEPRYGGNLQGITDRLDYLKSLGVTGLYLTPVNKSSSQHKYNTDDYKEIDSEFGGEKAMKTLCDEAHRRGMKIMLDGVFNHSGFEFPLWLDVFEKGEKSKYAKWFMVNDYDFVEPTWGPKSNTMRKKYYSFAFVDYMPKLNTNNPEVIEYFTGICKDWIRKYDIDALRLDVANEISHTFCRELRKAMDEEKKDFYIVGEIWHNAFPWLSSKEFDASMNYPLQNAIADFCIDEKISAKEFEYAVNRCFSMYYRQTNKVLLNQMDSHDTIRILNRCGKNKNRAREALALLFCMPGSVCIYYGTEIMLEGGYDPDCRRCMPWKEIDSGMFSEDMDFAKKLISLRKENPAFLSDKMEFVYDENFPENARLLHLVKEAEDGKDESGKIELFMNCTENDVKLDARKNVLVSSAYSDSDGTLSKDGFVIFGL